MGECLKWNKTAEERARYWREREATSRTFLFSNCMTVEARRIEERWAERYKALAEEQEHLIERKG